MMMTHSHKKGKTMTSKEFAYWLKGFIEINEAGNKNIDGLTKEQFQCIKKHLSMVFYHEIDPSYKDGDVLTNIHNTYTPPAFSPDTLIRC